LEDHLPDSPNGDLCALRGPIGTFGILVGIDIAMRFVHS
jgi:hypothetical protein